MAGAVSQKRVIITVSGIVQGVGFRPFVFHCATKNHLKGLVYNNTSGVLIDVEGEEGDIRQFEKDLLTNPPPLAVIDAVDVKEQPLAGYQQFTIKHSLGDGRGFIPVSPDMATCPDCLREMNDPKDIRFHYPFINCTNCGPRFSIIEDIPYDRPKTSMRVFPMCRQCEKEYTDPRNRRFHAQPVACPECGPGIAFIYKGVQHITARYVSSPADVDEVLGKATALLKNGGVLALKGLGGFHLAVNAKDAEAVKRLRERKHRYAKPLALMMKDMDQVKSYCSVTPEEMSLLSGARHPIVILKALPGRLPDVLSPGLNTLGVMLPYTPLHHLIMDKVEFPLVMTSGNVSEEPICRENDEALVALENIADGFLIHNRSIVNRIDDTVCFYAAQGERMVRRARGYAPEPVRLVKSAPPLIACGAFYKNTFCLAQGEYAFLSQHIGDLDEGKTFEYYKEQIHRYESLFRVNPHYAVRDLHPEYMSTLFAESLGLPVLGVQHHHAHIASVIAEYSLQDRVLGVAYDGTGLGTDGRIWGGEFLVADCQSFERVGHIKYVPLPGGDLAVKQPFRSALGFIYPNLDFFKNFIGRFDKKMINIVLTQIEKTINSPLTSSMGRLFDAASSLLNIRDTVSFEGQAAMELEAALKEDDGYYNYSIVKQGTCHIIDVENTLRDMYMEFSKGIDRGIIASRFHNTIVRFTTEMLQIMRDTYRINRVVLSGGCFQNRYLLEKLNSKLTSCGFEVFIPRRIPINDGGISLGQAVIAIEKFACKK